MPTLLLNSRFSDDSQKLWRACIGTDWKVERIHGWKVPSIPASEAVIYGEPLFARHVAQTLKLNLLEPTADWLARLPRRWSGRRVQATTLAAARQHSSRAFIKPAEDKCFDARVYATGAELPAQGLLPEDLPVLLQEVVAWTLEYRCFVSYGAVMTVSPYWQNNGLAQSPEGDWPAPEEEKQAARHFCEEVLRDPEVITPAAVVVDVGVIQDHGWAVIESNAAWAAGTVRVRRSSRAEGSTARVQAPMNPRGPDAGFELWLGNLRRIKES